MELILGYLLFAVTTGIVCLISLHLPVVRSLQQLENPPEVVQGAKSTMVLLVLFVCAVLAAPAMLIIYLVDEYSERFKESLYNNLLKDEEVNDL